MPILGVKGYSAHVNRREPAKEGTVNIGNKASVQARCSQRPKFVMEGSKDTLHADFALLACLSHTGLEDARLIQDVFSILYSVVHFLSSSEYQFKATIASNGYGH